MPYRRKKGPLSAASDNKAVSRNRTSEIVDAFDACRCKDVSRMTPKGLFSLMLSDLAFWKRRR